MSDAEQTKLDPVSFLQLFVTQSVHLGSQLGCAQCDEQRNYIELLGLTASRCFEAAARKQLRLSGPMDADAYADTILHLKNRIGGRFSRISSEPGVVRVENTRCPFGDMVKDAPELCHMTSSVFGGIAARNFGYAKVELARRIATNDGRCEVCIYLSPESAKERPGTEYRSDEGMALSPALRGEVTAQLTTRINRVLCQVAAKRGEEQQCRPEIVAHSEAMRAALEAVEVVAPTRASVLISGETGVGKEVIARATHALSERATRPFVAVNCGAIPEDLIESALFGHERGAFTGAYDVHQGFFERAEGGTLFLDEIDSLPPSAQVKLLRVLQEGDYERVGGRQTLSANVRIIAASNRNMETMVADGDFRMDLYYRLNVVAVHIPPLRERTDDMADLVRHLLARLSERYDSPRKFLGERAWRKVMAYRWPGNIRELENILERAFLFSKGPIIEDVPVDVARVPMESGDDELSGALKSRMKKAAQQVEADMLREALGRFGGNVTAVARAMDITPRAVHQKLRKHGIEAAEYRGAGATLHVVKG
ncbi:MAG: sigma 54-interacting transcriptional regulator [Gammaproteobacteria bacterium]|nr:sigma 54-interacting transcriptional regulator [Gammaproteobacteria bacterium]MDJ0891365.1 sigma 54-interacting transcriptional regulator [Gammaproteobacteria bacterium]